MEAGETADVQMSAGYGDAEGEMRGRGNRLAEGRTMMLVDIENLCGTGLVGVADVIAVKEMLWRVVELPRQAQVTVATSAPATIVDAGRAWPEARALFRPGHDGADHCLLAVIREENLGKRFAHVVIASGDGIFSAGVGQLRAQGVLVTVVANRGSTAGELRASADRFVEFPGFRSTHGSAAAVALQARAVTLAA